MLTQPEVDRLLQVPKVLEQSNFDFPAPGEAIHLEAHSEDRRDAFIFDINRKGARLKITKCTYQNRHSVSEILLRLDLDGPTHTNPDGEIIPCPHLHTYREGYGDKWAVAVPESAFSDTGDLVQTFVDFLRYSNVNDIPEIQRGIE